MEPHLQLYDDQTKNYDQPLPLARLRSAMLAQPPVALAAPDPEGSTWHIDTYTHAHLGHTRCNNGARGSGALALPLAICA